MDILGTTVCALELWINVYLLLLKMPKSLCSWGNFCPLHLHNHFIFVKKEEKGQRHRLIRVEIVRKEGEREIEMERMTFLHIPILAFFLFILEFIQATIRNLNAVPPK